VVTFHFGVFGSHIFWEFAAEISLFVIPFVHYAWSVQGECNPTIYGTFCSQVRPPALVSSCGWHRPEDTEERLAVTHCQACIHVCSAFPNIPYFRNRLSGTRGLCCSMRWRIYSRLRSRPFTAPMSSRSGRATSVSRPPSSAHGLAFLEWNLSNLFLPFLPPSRSFIAGLALLPLPLRMLWRYRPGNRAALALLAAQGDGTVDCAENGAAVSTGTIAQPGCSADMLAWAPPTVGERQPLTSAPLLFS